MSNNGKIDSLNLGATATSLVYSNGCSAASSPLQALEETRAALLAWQEKMQAALDAERAQLHETQARLNATQTALGETQVQNQRVASTLAETQALLEQRAHHLETTQAEAHHAATERDTARAEIIALQVERDRLRDDYDRATQACQELGGHVSEQAERNKHLHREMLELYRDLRAEDLPTLILRIGMKLTGADHGLYVDQTGECTIAAIGMDELPEVVTSALYAFTREAAQSEAPVVRNDSDNLPDGANLVNLAALPVAAQGDLRGVLLVANKRTGDFTDDDTDLLLSIGNHAGVALENNRLHCQLAESYISTIAVLADAIEAKDPYTRGHCESVAAVALDVARLLGWEGIELDNIRYAALLHDVGKIGIPDGVLLKPGRLLPEEYQMIQRHSLIGSDLVRRVPALEAIAPIILHHHERVDGSGYPDGQSGEEITMASRIIGVVDAFDAMTTPRPYRDPVSPQEALEELRRCAGGQFDSAVVDTVAKVLAQRGQL